MVQINWRISENINTMNSKHLNVGDASKIAHTPHVVAIISRVIVNERIYINKWLAVLALVYSTVQTSMR